MKEFLSRQGVQYQERKVDVDPEAYQEFMDKQLGHGVPVILIDGEKVVGFNEPRLRELLQ